MANNLTGDFEAVVQVGVRQINGLLATLHQNGAAQDAELELLHSASFRVGDPRRTRPDVVDFGDWVLAYHRTNDGVRPGALPEHLTTTAPAGAAGRMKTLFAGFGLEAEIPPDVVRGLARVQISTLALSLPGGSTSEVTLHAHVRADFSPDAGTTDLPRPVHGEVQATFEVRSVPAGLGRRLVIQPSAQDSKIVFVPHPGSGLGTGDAAKISTQVRKAVRESIELLPVDLPAEFPFSTFKGVGTGAGQAVAFPIRLSGTGPPAGDIQSISGPFVGPAGFAVAVSRDFVKAQFQGMINKLLAFRRDIPIRVWRFRVATYKASVNSVELQFNNGSIDFVVKGTAAHWFWPDYSFTIRQRLTLVLLFDTLFIAAPDDELTISGLPGGATDRVRLEIVAERNRSLPPAQEELNKELRNARTKLNSALSRFDRDAAAGFRAGHSDDPNAGSAGGVAITPDGVIVRGDISGAARLAPVVQVQETNQGQAFTALESWIPGGRIDRFVWSWVEYAHPFSLPWSGVAKSLTDEHRFVLPKPPGITNASQICLRIEGVRTSATGEVSPVIGGTSCIVPQPEVAMNVPAWWEPVTVPVWTAGKGNGAIARDSISAHVSVQSVVPGDSALTRNTLVYFADADSEAPLQVVADAVGRLRGKSAMLGVIVVLPVGAFDRRPEELERRLASGRSKISAQLLVTEDDEAGWTRTFALEKMPSAYLLNARREFVWQHAGQPDAETLAAALEKHVVPAPAPTLRALRLAVAPGERAPDVFFADGDQPFALHRLRGRKALLNFWQSWSAPCQRELLRLQALQQKSGRDAPFIVAFHGGRDGTPLETIRKQCGPSIVVVQDTEQRIARRYGVRCWPTTVTVDGNGIVESVQFGTSSTDRSGAPADGKPRAS